MPIIGVSGQAGSGKDSFAARLVEEHDFVRVALADGMKRIARDVYGFTLEQLWGPSQMRNAGDRRYLRSDGTFLSPREALQVLGTEWGRACWPNTWVNHTLEVARQVLEGRAYSATSGLEGVIYSGPGRPVGVVVPDVRFENELAAIRAAGGVNVRVKRAGATGQVGIVGHASELEQQSIPDAEFDFVVDNNGTLEQLANAADAIAGQLANLEVTG